MKTITTGFRNHLALEVTQLTTCWKVTRTDGVILAFTSLDVDLVIDLVTYQSTNSFTRTAIETGSTFGVDNLEVLGPIADDGFDETDLRVGKFDFAEIEVFIVVWSNLSLGKLKVRKGWLGEVSRGFDGSFQAELRGLSQALVQEFGATWQPICRADLGDAQCKIPIAPTNWGAGGQVAVGDYTRTGPFPVDDAHAVAIFQAQNAGMTGLVEPTWDMTIGHSTTDNGIVWVAKPAFRGITTVASVASQRQFTASLSSPAFAAGVSTTGVISIRNNISAGTVITVSDGILEDARDFPFDTAMKDAANTLWNTLVAATFLQMTFVRSGGNMNVIITNNSGVPGSITKTGDKLGAVVIQNFSSGSSTFDGGAVTWVTGLNAGQTMEIKSYDPGTSTVTLWLNMTQAIAPGDKFYFYPGCDKRRSTCRQVFDNMLNFRAEPDMPGVDQILSYPNL